MRLGKIETKVLKVLYEHEQKQKVKGGFHNRSLALRPKRIVEKMVKINFPSEKKFNLSKRNKDYHLMFLAQVCSLPKKEREKTLAKDPIKKFYSQHQKARKEWNKKTNSIFRAIQKLYTWELVWREKGYVLYGLTETGRRVISHRINKKKLGVK